MSALGTHVFDYGHKAAADQMRTSWEKLAQYCGTINGQNIHNELSNKTPVILQEPVYTPAVMARHQKALQNAPGSAAEATDHCVRSRNIVIGEAQKRPKGQTDPIRESDTNTLLTSITSGRVGRSSGRGVRGDSAKSTIQRIDERKKTVRVTAQKDRQSIGKKRPSA